MAPQAEEDKVILPLIAFLGLPSGIILSFFTKEELKTGRLYFEILAVFFFSLAIAYLVPAYSIQIFIALFLPLFFLRKRFAEYSYMPFALIGAGAIFATSYYYASVFLMGLPIGSMLYERAVKKDIRILYYLFYLPLAYVPQILISA